MPKDHTIDWQKLVDQIDEGIQKFRRLKGREPKSLQMIIKSDQEPDHSSRGTRSPADDQRMSLTDLEKAALNKALADEDRKTVAKNELDRRHRANLEILDAAEAIQDRDGGTYAAAVAKALDEDPSLYRP